MKIILYNPLAKKNKYLKSYKFDSEWDGQTFEYGVTPNRNEACVIKESDVPRVKKWLKHWIPIYEDTGRRVGI